MFRKLLIWSVLVILAASFSTSCKRTYFYLKEEVHDNEQLKFNTKKSYYQYGKQITLSQGSFRIDPGDDALLYIKGETTVTGVGEPGVMTLDFREIAHFYINLTPPIGIGRYDTRYKAICEIINSTSYTLGDNLFTCQQGEVVIDSLKGDKIFGTITGRYLSSGNKRLTIEGNIKAKRQ